MARLAPVAEGDAGAIGRYTHTGNPLGTEEFVTSLEVAWHGSLAPEKGGRAAKLEIYNGQGSCGFATTLKAGERPGCQRVSVSMRFRTCGGSGRLSPTAIIEPS